MLTARLMMGACGGAGGSSLPFDLQFDHLWFVDGPAFQALNYLDTNGLTTIPDEVGSADFTDANNGWTYDAETAALSNLPSMSNSAVVVRKTTFASIAAPYSVVMIAACQTSTAGQYLTDGSGASNRHIIGKSASGGTWLQFAGAVRTGGAFNTSWHGFVSVIVSGTSDKFAVDGATIGSGSAGDHSLTGVTLGGAYDSGAKCPASYVLIGVYAGDVTADGDWAGFQSWASTTYGITI